MARLYRPHIPLLVRCQVAERQMERAVHCLPTNEFGVIFRDDPKSKLKERLDAALFHLAKIFGCEVKDLRLDHDPPLALRMKRSHFDGKKWIKFYSPDANEPAHLFYRPHGTEFEGSHDVKTRIRGDNGQYSDLVLIKRERRRQKKAKSTSVSSFKNRGPKRKWATRKLQSASRWPKGRKLGKRGK